MGNPSWLVWQRSPATDNTNVSYPEVGSRIAEPYVARFVATNKNSLYDTHKTAIPKRWAPVVMTLGQVYRSRSAESIVRTRRDRE